MVPLHIPLRFSIINIGESTVENFRNSYSYRSDNSLDTGCTASAVAQRIRAGITAVDPLPEQTILHRTMDLNTALKR